MANVEGDAVRRGLLADMGIDVWVMRRDAGDVVAHERAASAEPDPAPTVAGEAEPLPEPRPTHAPQAPPGAELDVACLASGRTLLLVDDAGAEQQRLLGDIVLAAGGDSTAAPRELNFHWSGDEATRWRAFGAFVDKQLVDHAPRVILCSEVLCMHLPAESADLPVIALPPLARLGRSAQLKRELWRQIQSLPA